MEVSPHSDSRLDVGDVRARGQGYFLNTCSVYKPNGDVITTKSVVEAVSFFFFFFFLREEGEGQDFLEGKNSQKGIKFDHFAQENAPFSWYHLYLGRNKGH